MTSRSQPTHSERPIKDALQPMVTSQSTSTLGAMSQAIMAPFTGAQDRSDHSTKILTGLAPVIMTPRMVQAAASSSRSSQSGRSNPLGINPRVDFNSIGRAPLRLALKRQVTSNDLGILESTPELLSSPIPEADGVAKEVSLLKGFKATIPSSENSKSRRRKIRNVELEEEGSESGMRSLGMQARAMLTDEPHNKDEYGTIGKRRKSGRRGDALATSKILGKEELNRQRTEILQDKENLHVRRKLAQAEIDEITRKIDALDAIRARLEGDILRFQEEELELDDELRGVEERKEFEDSRGQLGTAESWQTSRRRKGPAFLPSGHDDLPRGVAFMTLTSHSGPINALDFSEPYGLLVTASQDESTRLWDLSSGEELAFLRGHTGPVKCIQVEGDVCVTGGSDNTIRIWDLRAVEEEEESLNQSFAGSSVASSPRSAMQSIPDADAEDEEDAAVFVERPKGTGKPRPRGCLRVLEGHSRSVSSIYFEESCLVSGASDKTIRQWDINTGQCVLTMDILWAISHPPPQPGPSTSPRASKFAVPSLPGASLLSAASTSFSFPAPPMADGSWDMYTDFVGGVQFWGYALVSGSGDGAVRMWDMRTGQSHRTLIGHTAPVTCVQFDELHIVSGSLDKTVRIWDLRTGSIAETLRYDYPITSLQFDSRKVYNRTTMQNSSFATNGHTLPVEKLRYMDRYLVSGGRDSTVKLWAI
ncbi:Mitochondrial fission protein [Serendipita sp. 399]|nr:Mitochondrial fission protein [Serendipita sp. 399]